MFTAENQQRRQAGKLQIQENSNENHSQLMKQKIGHTEREFTQDVAEKYIKKKMKPKS